MTTFTCSNCKRERDAIKHGRFGHLRDDSHVCEKCDIKIFNEWLKQEDESIIHRDNYTRKI
jgi:hypothetical protein